ncbi:NADPH:quinone reductase [Microlunatus endophyticus]|uniref:NADPH:quinone reductase n=1 Tax=Microlunatus endophyticus TaxID=1716077 RepID=A0A917SE18_9ACTN|nr:zinc-binding dehydrogenase [Microlunatus endophyticus]GGL73615.1 NADPH:quinone reductase [Microlunatus endophyticus]
MHEQNDGTGDPATGSTRRDRTNRAVLLEAFGGPETLVVREVAETQAGPGQIRVRVTAAGLNPMDWVMTSDPETAARFGLSLPCGFGTDFAGVVDQVGAGAIGYATGDRVFGAALSRSVADHVVIDAQGDIVAGVAHHTPDDVDDVTAATLAIAGSTAAAALAVLDLGPEDVLLVGGAGGGVGVFAVQLAAIVGARVIGTGSPASAEHLRSLGVEPVAYGDGVIDRIRDLDIGPVTAALDLHGTDTVRVARDLGVPDQRICTIAAQLDGVPAANGANAGPAALENIADLVAAGRLRVPIAATFPIEDIREAVELQAARHVRGKVVIDLLRAG